MSCCRAPRDERQIVRQSVAEMNLELGELRHHGMVKRGARNLLVVAAVSTNAPHCFGVFLSKRELQRDTPHIAVDRNVTGDCERDFNLTHDKRNTHNEKVDPTQRSRGMSGMAPATLTAVSSSNGARWRAMPALLTTEVVALRTATA